MDQITAVLQGGQPVLGAVERGGSVDSQVGSSCCPSAFVLCGHLAQEGQLPFLNLVASSGNFAGHRHFS